jgi:prepilin-type N-terminal cleavage/methylation domain-containing protein
MRHRNGFTLIELMIVVVVIGILAGLAIPRFMNVSRSSKEAEAKPLLRQIYTLEERYHARTDSYTLDISLLEGGAGLATGGRYFTYGLAAHASGFCVTATPSAQGVAAGLGAQSMDASRNFYESGNCS